MQEREIDLVDLMVEVFLHWRLFLVWMLCGAVVLGGFSYVRALRSANAQAVQVEEAKRHLEAEQDLIIDQKLLQQVASQLDDDQLHNVEIVVAFEKLYHEQLTYQEQSTLMQMDANNVQKAVVSVWISSDSDKRSNAVEAAYEGTVQGGRMAQYVADQLEMTVSDVAQLISLSDTVTKIDIGETKIDIGEKDIFTLEVINFDELVCRNMAQAVVEFIKNEQDDFEEIFGEFEIVVLAQEPVEVYESRVADDQTVFINSIIFMQDTIARKKNEFTDEQWQYYDVMVNGELTGLDSTGTVPMSPEAIIERGVTVTPKVSSKYVLLGMVLAAFVYALYIFMLYVLNTKVRITDDLQQLYEIPQLGRISGEKEEKSVFNFIDKWILSLRNRNKRKFAKEEAMNLAIVAVKMSAERNSLNSVYLMGCDLKEQAMIVCEQIKESLNRDDMQVHILNNVLYDTKAMSDLEKAQGVVLVEQAGSTLYDEIGQELRLLNRQGIKVLGGIIVG